MTRCLQVGLRSGSACLFAGEAAHQGVLRVTVVSAVDRSIEHAAGTSSGVAHDGGYLGALVLFVIQRATHYEGVTVRCSRAQNRASFMFAGS